VTKLCYLDFDGSVHSSEVYVSRDFGIQMREKGRVLFEWAPMLDELLAPHPDVSIVLSTSWVAEFGFEFARKALPTNLERRVIGSTYTPENLRYFDAWTRGRQVTSDVQIRRPDAWFAIDDDLSGWPDFARGRLIQTEGATGISPPEVQDAIRRILITM
jgi:hypothetical protein